MVLGIGKLPEPNKIDTISVPATVGCLGLVACPGVRVEQASAVSRKHLRADIQALQTWGATGVVSFIEAHEFRMNNVEDIPNLLHAAGIWWLHLPIIDMEITDQKFEDEWAVEGERIRHALRIGERVALHCYAGLGRTGMMGARLLVEMGMEHERAIAAVRKPNPRRIQTKRQSMFVHQIQSLV